MIKKARQERGSYTLEATISLLAMVIAIAFVYSQIKVVICESIMQHAVDNMALEMSSYVYILDKLGVVAHTDAQEALGTLDETVEAGEQAVESGKGLITNAADMTETLGGITDIMDIFDASSDLKADAEAGKENAESMLGSLSKMISLIKSDTFMESLKTAGKLGAEGIINSGINDLLNGQNGFYSWKLDSYLPTDREAFCKRYLVDPDSISFQHSRLFPGTKNNTILVVVEYRTNSPFSWFPVKRKIVKQAFTSAWLANPDNS